MDRLFRPVVLIFVGLIALMQGYDINKDDIPEGFLWKKPISKTIVIGHDGTGGDIIRNNWQDVIIADGPGTFISAIVSKKGGSNRPANDTLKTTVRLTLDRKEILMKSFEVARAMGLSEQNYSGVVRLTPDTAMAGEGDIETLVLGYSEELYFTERLILSVIVDDPLVEKVLLSVTFTKKDTGDDEHMGGGDHEPRFP